jgi:hypothetical protein
MADLFDAATEYVDKFGDSPPVAGLPASKHDAAADLILKAVADGEPFASDAAFYEALGLKPLPAGALT